VTLPSPQRPARVRTRVRSSLALKRLPADFCWQFFDALCVGCESSMTVDCLKRFREVARKRDVSEYYKLDNEFGLQSMTELRIGPRPVRVEVSYMLSAILRKCADMPLVDRVTRKEQCLKKILITDASIPPLRKEWESTTGVYAQARYWLRDLLGPPPDDEEVAVSARHGPGSSASIPFGLRSRYFKYATVPYRCTPASRSLLTYCIQNDARWASALEDHLRHRDQVPMWAILDRPHFWNVVCDGGHPYNVVTTVPKDGRKDRPIAKEQTGSVYLQLALGTCIRSRLRAFGVDLNKQADYNRARALRSSRSKDSFTIDLSDASDTVGYALVESLLPPGWFKLLCSCRAPWGVLPSGEAFLYRKFSSMGNGYTFELETIIFMAICIGVSRTYGHKTDHWDVFGDDIIGPDYLYLHTKMYLEYAGFRVNSEKSFHGNMPVRESCGVDALNGVNIRPVFVKNTPTSVMELIGLRNRIRGWFLRYLGFYPDNVETFLLGYFSGCPPFGPDSNVEFDGWLHDGPKYYGCGFDSLVCGLSNLPAREFGLRKLMHTLRSCSGDGGNFIVGETSQRIRLVRRIATEAYDASEAF
jgi:hypothetical protein